MHARPVGVEDARHLDVELVLAVIVEEQGLGAALAFIIAGPGPDRVDIPPIVLGLGMDGRVAVDLRGGGLKDPALQPLGKAQHVDGAMHARFGRLHGVVLVVDRGGRAGEIIDLVHLEIERKGDIVTDELEARVADQMLDIALGAGEEIVDAKNIVPVGEEPVTEMRPEKPRSACNQDGFTGTHV